VPANLTNDADLKAYRAEDGSTSFTKRNIVIPGGGANLVVVDIAPGGISGMHQTISIDFSICVNGRIEHELDSGEKVTLLPGVRTHFLQGTSNIC
jgi:quercetin dioxygenase-like cupin family protein